MLRDKDIKDRIKKVNNKLMIHDVEKLLLLGKIEKFFPRVEQCLSQSMHVALYPSMTTLITRDLLRHSDLDVVSSCCSYLNETKGISLDDPYDDNLMEEISGLIIGAFKNLNEM